MVARHPLSTVMKRKPRIQIVWLFVSNRRRKAFVMTEEGLLRIKLVRATDLVPADSNGCASPASFY
jgi:hypothetical protein